MNKYAAPKCHPKLSTASLIVVTPPAWCVPFLPKDAIVATQSSTDDCMVFGVLVRVATSRGSSRSDPHDGVAFIHTLAPGGNLPGLVCWWRGGYKCRWETIEDQLHTAVVDWCAARRSLKPAVTIDLPKREGEP